MTGIGKEEHPARSIESPNSQGPLTNDTAPEENAWMPKVLECSAEITEFPTDLELNEVWYWLHSRLRAIGDLDHEPARLVALLTWNEKTVNDALHAARLEINQLEEEGKTRRAHLEYLTAEYLAHLALEGVSIPNAGLHPA